jgi:hypothetical protein
MASDDWVRKVADESEIRNLIAKLAIFADGADDLTQYGALFSEDATWGILPEKGKAPLFAPVKGRSNILAAALQRRKDGVSGPGTHAYHSIMMTAVDVKENRASSTSYFVFIKNADVKPSVDMFKIYKDQFVRIGEEWKLAARLIEPA